MSRPHKRFDLPLTRSWSRRLARYEDSPVVHLHARYDPDFTHVAYVVADLGNVTQVVHVCGCAEPEGHPLL